MTNVLVGIAGDTVGDCLTQKLERAKINDWNRSGRMGIMGGVLSVPYHHWYIYLDKLFPTNKAKDVAKKVLLDTTVMGPFYITGFYTGVYLSNCFILDSIFCVHIQVCLNWKGKRGRKHMWS